MAATELEKAYAAGIIDGEGCIVINHNKPSKHIKNGQFYPMVCVHITNKAVLDWLQNIWGGSITTRPKGKDHWKESYEWKIQSSRSLEFIREILPYMIIKVDEAKIFLNFNTQDSKSSLTEDINKFRLSLKKELSSLKKGQ